MMMSFLNTAYSNGQTYSPVWSTPQEVSLHQHHQFCSTCMNLDSIFKWISVLLNPITVEVVLYNVTLPHFSWFIQLGQAHIQTLSITFS